MIVLALVVLFTFSLVSRDNGIPATSAQLQGTASANPAFAWAKTWAGTVDVVASNVAVDQPGNLYVVGQFWGTVDFDPAGPNVSATITSTQNTCDAFLSKFDSTGAFQWVRTWGGAPAGTPTSDFDGRDAANGVALDAAGNVYVAGLFQNTVDFGAGIVITSNAPSGSNNIFVSKFAPNGTIQWARAWGGKTGGEAYTVAVDKVRGYVYVEGDWSTSPNTGTVDFNPGGGGPGHDWHANHGFFDAFLAKYDLNGNFQWAKTWGGNQYDDGPGVAVDGNGNLYVAGMYGSTDINFDPAGTFKGLGHPASESSSFYVDFFLSKFDSEGNFQWVKTWGTAGTEEAGGPLVVDGANNVYVGGRFGCTPAVPCNFNPGGTAQLFSSNGDRDAFVIKYDSDGNYQWAKTWGGSGWDSIGGLAVEGVNNLSTVGFFVNTVDFNPWGGGDVHVSQGSRDIFLNQFDSTGNFKWAKIWGGSGDDMSLGVALDGIGNLFAAGSFSGTVNFNPWGAADPHVSTAGQGAFISMFAPTAMQVSPSTLAYLAEPTFPPRSFTLQINSSSVVTFTWTATFTPTTPMWVSAQPLSGQSGQTLTVVITPTTLGTFQSNLRLVSSDPQIQNNDQTVPILLDVVNDVYMTYLPLIQKGGS